MEKEVCTFTYSKRLAENNSEPPPDSRLMTGHLAVNVITGVRNGKQLVDEPVADAATFPLLASQT